MLRLVINLDRSKERLKRISDSLMNFGLRFSRVQAVDGRLLSEAEIKQLVIPKWKRQLFFRELTRTEVGCCLSHRKCWKMLVESAEEWALVLEDDCIFSNGAASFLDNEKWIPETVKLCQLSHSGESGDQVLIDKNKHKINNRFEVVRIPKISGFGAVDDVGKRPISLWHKQTPGILGVDFYPDRLYYIL